MRDFTTKVNDTAPLSSGILDATEFNSLALENENAVKAAGITLDAATGPDTSETMLAEAMTRHVGAALACSDSGTTNAYVLTMIGSFEPPTELFAELRVRWRPGAGNTGASVLNAFGFGTKALVDHALAPLSGGELEAGREAEAIYRPTVGAGSWVLPAWANALYVDPSPAAPTELGDGEGWSVDTGTNTGNLNFPGLTNSGTLDGSDIFARHKSGLGHRGLTWAQLSAALGGGGGLVGVQLLTASGTYTKTAGCNKALVFATGGGGGGGGTSKNSLSSGGGGGGTAIAFIDLTGIDTVNYTIGAGGAGGTGNAAGSGGGSTAFGSYAVATGGEGGMGAYLEGQGGLGGVGTTGMMLLGGQGGAPATGAYASGSGGSSFFGGGGRGGNTPANVPGPGGPGQLYGGGGGGANDFAFGGAGAPGCVLVLEFS